MYNWGRMLPLIPLWLILTYTLIAVSHGLICESHHSLLNPKTQNDGCHSSCHSDYLFKLNFSRLKKHSATLFGTSEIVKFGTSDDVKWLLNMLNLQIPHTEYSLQLGTVSFQNHYDARSLSTAAGKQRPLVPQTRACGGRHLSNLWQVLRWPCTGIKVTSKPSNNGANTLTYGSGKEKSTASVFNKIKLPTAEPKLIIEIWD